MSAPVTMINDYMQYNAKSLDYYKGPAYEKLPYIQMYLMPMARQEYIALNQYYYEQLQTSLPPKQFKKLCEIVQEVRINGLAGKPFPAKKVKEDAEVFGADEDEIVLSAKNMYNTIIAMKKDPSYTTTMSDFEALVTDLYDKSQKVSQAPENKQMLNEFTKAMVGLTTINQYPSNINQKLNNIGRRLGLYLTICSNSDTQKDCIIPIISSIFLRYQNLSKDMQDKFTFSIRKNYGQDVGAQMVNDIKQMPTIIDGYPPKQMLQIFSQQPSAQKDIFDAPTTELSLKKAPSIE